jgi:hypothetical protein
MQPKGDAPECSREAVYLPNQDTFLTLGERLWSWKPTENEWRVVELPTGESLNRTGQNRAMVYDPKNKIILLVLGRSGDNGTAQVYALRPGDRF